MLSIRFGTTNPITRKRKATAILQLDLLRPVRPVVVSKTSRHRTACRTRSRRTAAGIKRGKDEAGTMIDVGDLSDGEVSEAEACHACGVERVVGLHRVLQNGDSNGVVHRRGAEAAAEAEVEGLRAYGAHGMTLPRLPVRNIALPRRGGVVRRGRRDRGRGRPGRGWGRGHTRGRGRRGGLTPGPHCRRPRPRNRRQRRGRGHGGVVRRGQAAGRIQGVHGGEPWRQGGVRWICGAADGGMVGGGMSGEGPPAARADGGWGTGGRAAVEEGLGRTTRVWAAGDERHRRSRSMQNNG
jgi:hypothetical protein